MENPIPPAAGRNPPPQAPSPLPGGKEGNSREEKGSCTTGERGYMENPDLGQNEDKKGSEGKTISENIQENRTQTKEADDKLR